MTNPSASTIDRSHIDTHRKALPAGRAGEPVRGVSVGFMASDQFDLGPDRRAIKDLFDMFVVQTDAAVG